MEIKLQYGLTRVMFSSGETRATILGPWFDFEIARLQRSIAATAMLAPGEDPAPLLAIEDPDPVGLDAFLGCRVVLESRNDQLPARAATVLDAIRLYAHELGGVHHDGVVKHSLLHDLVPDAEPALRQTMVAIGRTLHRALVPLALLETMLQRPHPFGFDMSQVADVRRTAAE